MALEEHQIQQQRQAQAGNTQDHGETRATGNNRGQRDSTNNTAHHKEQWGDNEIAQAGPQETTEDHGISRE